MSHPEKALLASLVFPGDLGTIAREGLDLQCIPTEEFRYVVDWALGYYQRSGQEMAPSEVALSIQFPDLFSDHEIKLGYPEDSVEWALDKLKGNYVHSQYQGLIKSGAVAMAESDDLTRGDVIDATVQAMLDLSRSLQSRNLYVDAISDGFGQTLANYENRGVDVLSGMTFGFPEIDQHSYGVHDGELAILAAPPKAGKSYWAAKVAINEWQQGRTPVLYTLENSVAMTLDRMVCMAMGISSRDWQRGRVLPEQVEAVRAWVSAIENSDRPLWVLHPEPGKRTSDRMVQEAMLRDADSVIIDQLTFMEDARPSKGKGRPYEVRDILHDLKSAISSSRRAIPCLLTHQITRDGQKEAGKLGRLEMWHLAESSEAERTADFVFGLYQTADDKVVRRAKVQTLASRRTDLKHWQIQWDLELGLMRVLSELVFSD